MQTFPGRLAQELMRGRRKDRIPGAGLVASQPTLSKLQTSERSVSMERYEVPGEQHPRWSSGFHVHMHRHALTCTHAPTLK